ncbi:uncharacterized protein [Linepithema humile]|uniref:uncharacterized protein n=1 Tax=Linepithema humile TaxID=83485 RepID=UPI000623198C|nr:PREDICTED: uncharacterized protein LOC105676485 [Linepithema humile]XP_012229857.1 PREDICTED: uncharacterized protein LOC105676485 [Linepithema humile]
MGVTLLIVILTAALSVTANNISEQCQVHNESKLTCSCIGNEKLSLPENYDYKKIISVSVTGCVSVIFYYSTMPEANKLEEMVIENISDRLDFNIYISSRRMRRLKLSNIGRIPIIAPLTFGALATIDTFEIENVFIEDFQEELSFINVSHFIMSNVTIQRICKLNISEKGKTLRIVNSELRNITTSLNFASFQSIDIINSRFELQKPDIMSFHADTAIVKNSVFSNISLNLVATSITVNGICADGKSALRLKAENIDSSHNMLPNEINYSRDNQSINFFTNLNNIVCKAGNCKCPKSSGQALPQSDVSKFILGWLITLLSRCFY